MSCCGMMLAQSTVAFVHFSVGLLGRYGRSLLRQKSATKIFDRHFLVSSKFSRCRRLVCGRRIFWSSLLTPGQRGEKYCLGDPVNRRKHNSRTLQKLGGYIRCAGKSAGRERVACASASVTTRFSRDTLLQRAAATPALSGNGWLL